MEVFELTTLKCFYGLTLKTDNTNYCHVVLISTPVSYSFILRANTQDFGTYQISEQLRLGLLSSHTRSMDVD